MSNPVDCEPNEKMIRKHTYYTQEIFDLIMEDATQHTGGNLSMWVRRVLRKHYGLKQKTFKSKETN